MSVSFDIDTNLLLHTTRGMKEKVNLPVLESNIVEQFKMMRQQLLAGQAQMAMGMHTEDIRVVYNMQLNMLINAPESLFWAVIETLGTFTKETTKEVAIERMRASGYMFIMLWGCVDNNVKKELESLYV